MAAFNFNITLPLAWNFVPPVRNLLPVRFRVLVDGEATASVKRLRVTAGAALRERGTLYVTQLQEYSPWLELYDRVWLARASWLIIIEDMQAEPALYQGAVIAIDAAGTYTINIYTGAGGGGGGDLAAVAAQVRVDGAAGARDVVALERMDTGEWRLAGFSRLATGDLEVRTLGGRIYGVAVDDYGIGFLSGLAVSVGQRIRPTQFRGWLYEITEAGQLPVTEPEWWPIEGDNPSRVLGTARAVAVRYYQPIAHGPVPVEML